MCAIKPVIPPKSNRKVKRGCDFALYAERNVVERFFNTIKHYRGIATRYERPPAINSPLCTSSAHSSGSNDNKPHTGMRNAIWLIKALSD